MNEIQFNATFRAAKLGAEVNKSANCTLTMAGTQMVQQTQSIPTTGWTSVSFGNLAGVPAKVMLINNDPTNYLQLAGDNAGAELQDKLQPGGDFVIRSPLAAIYAQSHTAACTLLVVAVDA